MHKWKHSVFSEEDILDEFMPQTRREVVEHILGEVVSQVAMFKYVDNSDFLAEVTLKFRPVATGNLDTPIQSIGDKGPDIFVVLRGHVNLLDEQGEVVGVAGKGTAIFENELISSLGEDEGLDCPWKFCAPYSIIPSANGEVFTLRRPDFINILRRYPKVRLLPPKNPPPQGGNST
jgi:CRP-like cAMP-binding protein